MCTNLPGDATTFHSRFRQFFIKETIKNHDLIRFSSPIGAATGSKTLHVLVCECLSHDTIFIRMFVRTLESIMYSNVRW